mmetsp:Transcript_11215/g.31371  ORF Transcript_11215/g.31371 Transcript_11215/m.31371 type:complete len:322 (-) Transcript_11215:288-1253(-)
MGRVALFQPAKNLHGVLHRRLAHIHLLEAALEGGILLHVLPVLLQRRRTNHPQLPPRQHGLEKVGRVHGAVRLPGPQDEMHLVDEQNHLPRGIRHLLHHRLESLLELAPVLGTGDQRADIQRNQTNIPQGIRHIVFHDALRKPLHDGRLAHARLPNQHGVVLRAATEHPNHPSNLLITADDRIELRGAGRQIRTVLAERLKLVVSTLGVHPMGAPGLLEGVLDRLPRESALLHHTRNLFIRQQRQEQRIDPKEGVRLVLHDLAGLLEGSFQLASDEHVRRGGGHLWLQVDALGQQAPNGVVGALAPGLAERVSREPRGVLD